MMKQEKYKIILTMNHGVKYKVGGKDVYLLSAAKGKLTSTDFNYLPSSK